MTRDEGDENLETAGQEPPWLEARRTRRDVLKLAGAGALSFGGAAALAACGGGGGGASGPSLSGGQGPRRGGTLRVGLTGGSVNDTLDPSSATTPPSYAASRMIFDTLMDYDPDVHPIPKLAQEITPNHDATVWTIRLRPGVTFHDGKPLTADDLIFTFRYILNPKHAATYAPLLSPFDLSGLRKVDKLTVQVPCKRPYSILPDIFAYSSAFAVLPEHFDPKKPVGTGPFKFVSFTPGQQLVTERNNHYWIDGQPYVDKIVMTNYADETSEVNALLANQADIISLLSASSANEVKSGGAEIIVNKTGGMTPIVMRVDSGPFANPDVREAMKLMVDRQQMLDVIFDGMGTVANDLFSPYDRAYDHSIPQRPHDPEKAKHLLQKAGASDLAADFVTAPIFSGTVQLATVFAQQAKAIGVRVNVKQKSVADFYGPAWLSYPLTTDYWTYCTYLAQAVQATIPGPAPGGMFNETHFNDSRYNRLFQKALAEPDETRRIPLIHDMQEIDWKEGGYGIPYFYPLIDGHASNVLGMYHSKSGESFCNRRDFRTIYFA